MAVVQAPYYEFRVLSIVSQRSFMNLLKGFEVVLIDTKTAKKLSGCVNISQMAAMQLYLGVTTPQGCTKRVLRLSPNEVPVRYGREIGFNAIFEYLRNWFTASEFFLETNLTITTKI